MLLPWEYGVRNLARRPMRTALTLGALALVITLVLVVVGFIRGLERSLATSGNPNVVLVYSVNSEENIESSSIPAQIPSLLAASIAGVQERYGVKRVSPELYLGTRIRLSDGHEDLGLVRGVSATAPQVRTSVQLIDGRWPGPGEVIVGRLAATKLGVKSDRLRHGTQLEFEGTTWSIVGTFAAGGAAFESEIWCPLEDFQSATKRQDLSLVALQVESRAAVAQLSLFCKQRTDLEIRSLRETEYYASLQRHYGPLRTLAWLVVVLVAGAGAFAGLNLMYGSVAGRIREIATLQALGYRQMAVLISVLQEGLLLTATASLIAGAFALLWLNDMAVRFTMGAFELHVDSVAILIGCCTGLALGVLGALPPAIKALRQPVVAGLKAV